MSRHTVRFTLFRAFTLISVIILTATSALMVLAGGNPNPPSTLNQSTPEREEIVSIADLKGPEMERYFDTVITVDGIFVYDTVPMLVTDLDVVRKNTPPSEDRYILLAGDMVNRLEPEEYGGAELRVTGSINAADNQDDELEIYLIIESFELLGREDRYVPGIEEIVPPALVQPPQPTRYAILFSGGANEKFNWSRYWNDLTFMYSTLVNHLGFPPGNIAVLYADGKAKDTQIPVDYAATPASLQTVFGLLREVATENDLVFFFTTNHGGGFDEHDPPYVDSKGIWQRISGRQDSNHDEPASDMLWEDIWNLDFDGDGTQTRDDIVSWDEELTAWKDQVFDDEFSELFEDIAYSTMIIVMEQCFSGGLIYDMHGDNRIIISAAGETEPSSAMSTTLTTPDKDKFDEFSYYFTSALNGADHKGNGVNADTNNDGHVSITEAFNYARTNDTQPETPWYEDNGDGIPHITTNSSVHDDGELGSSIHLD